MRTGTWSNKVKCTFTSWWPYTLWISLVICLLWCAVYSPIFYLPRHGVIVHSDVRVPEGICVRICTCHRLMWQQPQNSRVIVATTSTCIWRSSKKRQIWYSRLKATCDMSIAYSTLLVYPVMMGDLKGSMIPPHLLQQL